MGALQGTLTLIVAADMDSTASGLTTGVESGAGENTSIIGQHINLSALFARVTACCVERAADQCGTPRLTAVSLNKDAALPGRHGRGLYGAGNINQTVDNLATGGGTQLYGAACSADGAGVPDQLVFHLITDRHRNQSVAIKINRRRIARRERHPAQSGADGAAVFDAGSNEADQSGLTGGNPAFIDNGGVRIAGAIEGRAARHEFAVVDIGRGRDQTVHIHMRRLAEEHPIGINQDDIAVGLQITRHGGRIGAVDAVEGGGAGAGLMETGGFIRGDVKRAPVDDGAVAALMDVDVFDGGGDGGAARRNYAVFRVSISGYVERESRYARQQPRIAIRPRPYRRCLVGG